MSPDPGVAVVESMPAPFGVLADTGETHRELNQDDLAGMTRDPRVVTTRASTEQVLAVDDSVEDDTNLKETGWAVLFASDVDPAVRQALQPLLDWRRSQVADDALFRVFEGPASGVKPQQKASSWAMARGVSLTAPVNPRRGVPFYLLIVGAPDRIPFEFQQQLDLQWAVGRLHFDDVAAYAEYAEKVVAYEKGEAPRQTRRAVTWMPQNQRDMATRLLAGAVEPDFDGVQDPARRLGRKAGFDYTPLVGAGNATKQHLTEILRGGMTDGAPAVLFTGSHGAEFPMSDADRQRAGQGALVTQEWVRGRPLEQGHCFAAADVPDDARLHGTMAFMFACFSGACPATDSYFRGPDGLPTPLAETPLVAKLPQELLRRGALAVIAHVDRAFAYSFQSAEGTPQVQVLRTPLERLMRGKPVGVAADPLNLNWSAMAALLGMALDGNLPGNPQPRPPTLANLFIARDDARNYVVLGDPAVRLNMDRLA